MRLGPEHPACMSERDAELWWEAERSSHIGGPHRATMPTSPCIDCNRAFAEAMRAEKRCDGWYPGENGEPLEPSLRARGYPTAEERIAARRATWRRSNATRRALQAAT